MTNDASRIQTREQENQVVQGIGAGTAGSQNKSPTIKDRVTSMLNKFLKIVQSSSRRRRALTTTPVESKTPQEVRYKVSSISQSKVKMGYVSLTFTSYLIYSRLRVTSKLTVTLSILPYMMKRT